MARPIKQTVDYFPHFVKGGKTLFILESKYGNDGYAFWFKLLELLCDSDGHYYDCRNQSSWEFLLAKTHTNSEKSEQIITTLVGIGKIDAELWTKRIIWVDSLLENLLFFYEKRNTPLPKRPNFDENNTDNSFLPENNSKEEFSPRKPSENDSFLPENNSEDGFSPRKPDNRNININRNINRKRNMCVNARARVTPTPAASSEDTHTDFLFEIEKAFFLRGFISPQLIAKDMIDYYTGEGKDLQLLPLRQAVAKVTNWNPKKESDYTRTDTGIAALFVSLVERMDISTSSKLKMIEAYKCIAWSGDHLIFKFTDNFIASAFRTYCKDYDELLSKHFNGIMKFIDAE